MIYRQTQHCTRYVYLLFTILLILLNTHTVLPQTEATPRDRYILTEEQKLEIMVHVWGEIRNPGQYLVPDGTNVLELISLAGGPNEYSSLTNIVLSREYNPSEFRTMDFKAIRKQKNIRVGRNKLIIRMNLQRHLEEIDQEHVYVLRPGDVISVKRNNWYKFQSLLRILTQISIIAQAVYYFSRIEL